MLYFNKSLYSPITSEDFGPIGLVRKLITFPIRKRGIVTVPEVSNSLKD